MKSKLAKVISMIGLTCLAIGVMVFLGKHSLNFFMSTFSGQDEIYAWLGLLLTSGGAIIWLYIFLNLADTTIRKAVTLLMMVVALIGEFATAGFDMYQQGTGILLTPDDIKSMSTVVALLGLLAGLALVAYAAGDMIQKAFQDDDGDGVPNYRDRHDNRKDQQPRNQPAPMNTNAQEVEIARLRQQVAALKANHNNGAEKEPVTDNHNTPPKA